MPRSQERFTKESYSGTAHFGRRLIRLDLATRLAHGDEVIGPDVDGRGRAARRQHAAEER